MEKEYISVQKDSVRLHIASRKAEERLNGLTRLSLLADNSSVYIYKGNMSSSSAVCSSLADSDKLRLSVHALTFVNSKA